VALLQQYCEVGPSVEETCYSEQVGDQLWHKYYQLHTLGLQIEWPLADGVRTCPILTQQLERRAGGGKVHFSHDHCASQSRCNL
jgi:hypothetical protein